MKLQFGLLLTILLILSGTPAPAGDKGEPTGVWKWTTEFGGQKRENTVKLKLDGGKLTGAYLMNKGQDCHNN